MWRWGILISLFFLFWSGMAFPARAQEPGEQFELARNAFDYQDYDKAIKLLRPLLLPAPVLPGKQMVLKAREMLGSSLWWRGDKAGFKEQFTELLIEDAEFELDSFYYPPEMVKEFADLKAELVEMSIIGKTPVRQLVEKTVVIQRTVARNNPFTPLLPFGIAQFANGEAGKGTFFLVGQVLALSINMGAWNWMYFGQATGTARDTGIWTMYSSLALFSGLYLWGTIDGFANYQDGGVLEEKRMENPGESVSMSPAMQPPGLDIPWGLGWEFTF